MPKFLHDSLLIFGRSARETRRQAPVALLAPTLLALSIVLLFDALYGDIAELPGYPVDAFIEWVAPAAVILPVFLGAGLTAASLIADVRSGYLDRLRLLPMRPGAMIAGRAAFDAVRALPPVAAVFGISLALGATHAGGGTGLLGLLALCAGLAVAWNGLFYLAVLATLNPAVIQGLQPVTFMPAVMFSSFWVPAALMPSWYAWIADHNPVTPIIDAARSLMLGPTDWGEVAVSVAVIAVLVALAYGAAALRLRALLRRA